MNIGLLSKQKVSLHFLSSTLMIKTFKQLAKIVDKSLPSKDQKNYTHFNLLIEREISCGHL